MNLKDPSMRTLPDGRIVASRLRAGDKIKTPTGKVYTVVGFTTVTSFGKKVNALAIKDRNGELDALFFNAIVKLVK